MKPKEVQLGVPYWAWVNGKRRVVEVVTILPPTFDNGKVRRARYELIVKGEKGEDDLPLRALRSAAQLNKLEGGLDTSDPLTYKY